MTIKISKLLSGRVPVVTAGNVTADRYQFLGLGQAEPNLGTSANGKDRKSTRLNSSHIPLSRMPSSA